MLKFLKRTGTCIIKIACTMVDEAVIRLVTYFLRATRYYPIHRNAMGKILDAPCLVIEYITVVPVMSKTKKSINVPSSACLNGKCSRIMHFGEDKGAEEQQPTGLIIYWEKKMFRLRSTLSRLVPVLNNTQVM